MSRVLFFDFDIPYLWKDSKYPVGGAAVELQGWIKGFNKINYPVGVLTFKGAHDFYLKQKSIEAEIVETYSVEKGIKFLKWLSYRVPSLFKAINRTKPKCIVQEVAGLPTGILAIICRVLNIPFFYRVANDIEADERIKERTHLFAYIFFRIGLRLSDGIVCQNKYQAERFKSQFPNKPTTIIYNPFEPALLTESIKNKSQRSYISWIGIFQRQKNLPTLLNVAEQLPGFSFKIGGIGGKNVDDATKDALVQLEKLPNVEFVGYVTRKDLPAFLSNAVTLLNTSFYEGFSNTFLEAFSVGTPICTTKNVDPDSIIEKHKLGIVAENHNMLVDAIKTLDHLSEEQYQKLSENCENYVVSNHEPGLLANRFKSFINGL